MAGSVQSAVLAIEWFTRLPYSPTGLDLKLVKWGLNFTPKASKSGNPGYENGRPGSLSWESPGLASPALGPTLDGRNIYSKGVERVNPSSELPPTQVSAGCRVR